MKIAHITDVEGNLPYFQTAVSLSPILSFDDGDLKFVDTQDNSHFVFGGDLVDKGPFDKELCRILVTFKRRHPSRVHLILGNRDLNKLRYAAELSDEDMSRPINDIPKPHWDKSVPSLLEYLHSIINTINKEEQGDGNKQIITIESVNTKTNRLKYIQMHTLGCTNTFNNRRIELSAAVSEGVDITDDMVTNDFLNDVMNHESYFFQFLRLGCIAVRLGDTIFVHGALDANTSGWVPSEKQYKFEIPKTKLEGMFVDTVDEWICLMNKYLQDGLDDFIERPYWYQDRTSRGGEGLMALQNRDAMWGRSVISNCFSDGGCITTRSAKEKRIIRYEQGLNDPSAFSKINSDPMDPRTVDWL